MSDETRAQQTPVSLIEAASVLTNLWSPRVVGRLNTHLVKVARAQGEFPWHVHDEEDELFLVLKGTLYIGRSEMDGGPVTLRSGEFFVVPRGVRHNTSTAAGEECLLALIEPAATLHSGRECTPLTRSIAEQLG